MPISESAKAIVPGLRFVGEDVEQPSAGVRERRSIVDDPTHVVSASAFHPEAVRPFEAGLIRQFRCFHINGGGDLRVETQGGENVRLMSVLSRPLLSPP